MIPSPDPMFPGHMQSGEHGTPGNIGTLPDSSLPLSILHLAVSWEGHLLVHTCLEGKASLKVASAAAVALLLERATLALC